MRERTHYLFIMFLGMIYGFVMAINDIYFWESISYWIILLVAVLCYVLGADLTQNGEEVSK